MANNLPLKRIGGCDKCRGQTPPPGARCRYCSRHGPTPPHRCHAIGCEVAIPPRLLMCKRHWFMVPPDIRARVWDEYVPGQEIRKDPTDEYLDVTGEAIRAVAEREGKL